MCQKLSIPLPCRLLAMGAALAICFIPSGTALAQNDVNWIGGASGLWSNLSNWDSPAVPDGSVNVLIDGGVMVTLDTAVDVFSLDLDDGDALTFQPGQTLETSNLDLAGEPMSFAGGTIDVGNGTLSLDDQSGSTFNNTFGLIVVGDVTDGAGTLEVINTPRLEGDGSVELVQGSEIVGDAGVDELTNAGFNTIRGNGAIRSDLFNLSTIEADGADDDLSLILADTNGSYTVVNDAIGSLRAEEGGTLRIRSEAADGSGNLFSSGQIVADTSATVSIENAVSVTGGTVNATASGLPGGGSTISVAADASLRADLETDALSQVNADGRLAATGLNNAGNINIHDGGQFTVDTNAGFGTGTFTNTGTISVEANSGTADGTVADAEVRIDGDATLNGNGSLILQDNAPGDGRTAELVSVGDGDPLTDGESILTLDPGSRIEGQGQIRANLHVNGTVDANVSGRVLEIVTAAEPATGEDLRITGVGTMQATNGGILRFSKGANAPFTGEVDFFGNVIADNGTIDVRDGVLLGTPSGVNLQAINGGSVQIATDAIVGLQQLSVDATSSVTSTGALGVTGLNNQGMIDLDGSRLVNLDGIGGSGTLTNDGSMSLVLGDTVPVITVAPDFPPGVRVDGSVTLDGNGTFTLGDIDAADADGMSIYTETSGSLTNAAGHTIQAVGEVRIDLTNQGTLRTQTPGQSLDIVLAEIVNNTDIDYTVSNEGQMIAANGGQLNIVNNNFFDGQANMISPGGTLQADAGTVQIGDAVGYFGGQTVAQNAGEIRVDQSAALLSNVQLDDTSSLQNEGFLDLFDLDNQGTLDSQANGWLISPI